MPDRRRVFESPKKWSLKKTAPLIKSGTQCKRLLVSSNEYRPRQHKHKHGSKYSQSISYATYITLTILLYSLIYASNAAENLDGSHLSSVPRKKSAENERLFQQQSLPKRKPQHGRQPELSRPKRRAKKQKRSVEKGHTSSLDNVIRYLDKLAKLPAAQLWDVLGMEQSDHYGENPFSLRELEGGKCPWSTTDKKIDWLPYRPANSEAIAEKYRGIQESLKRTKLRKRALKEQYDADNAVVLWYEHMSKSGGTAFCGIAKSNLPKYQVPGYHCMPKKGARKDGRVGSWPNTELIEYLGQSKHSIVANEWDAFPVDKLQLSGRTLDGTTLTSKGKNNTILSGPQFLFLTTIRDTQDRLLSAYTFFAITIHKEREEGENRTSFSEWTGRVKSNKSKSAPYTRMNHITWRFSEGKLPRSTPANPGKKAKIWKPHFEAAIRALSQIDLILPLDLMTQDLGKAALRQLLGWKRFDAKGTGQGDKTGGHVVTVGEVKNSNARDHFSKDEYRALWEDNWLDNILYLWCRAVFLARMHCKDVVASWEGDLSR